MRMHTSSCAAVVVRRGWVARVVRSPPTFNSGGLVGWEGKDIAEAAGRGEHDLVNWVFVQGKIVTNVALRG